jgi:glycosyltransferase 2 family protein
VVAASPSRILVLFGSNLVSLLITAASLGCMVRAMQPGLSYGTVVAVTAGAALFASVIPVPGNVGVAEAAITAGLGLAGVPTAPAFAIAVTQRIATSYLPSLAGVYSLRWLRREDYA